MSTPKIAGAIGLLSLATFIVILDATIINVAIPHVAAALSASPSEATWVITSYAVAEALTVPLSGWLVERFGATRLLVGCLACFSFSSALCGSASSLRTLILFRVLQGLSGGPLIPVSQTLIMKICPPKKLEMAMGLWMMTSIAAPIAGPLAGGVLADTLGWRWAFYLNVPVAAACALGAIFFFRDHLSKALSHSRIDFQGLFFLCVWVSALQIMLGTGEDSDWFRSSINWWLLAIALIGLVVFVAWELTDRQPIVDLTIFRYSGFTVCALVMFVAFGAFFAALILMPLWLQLAMGYTATQAGMIMAGQAVLGLVAAPLAAGLMRHVDPRGLMSFGLAILAASILLRSGFATSITFNKIMAPQLLMGLGLPFFFVPIMALSLTVVPPSATAAASGIINFVRTIAGAVATAGVVAAWNVDAKEVHAQLAMLAKGQALLQEGRVGAQPDLKMVAVLDQAAWGQAQTISANNISLVIGLLLAICAAAVWCIPKPAEERLQRQF
jgi:DHA2 family multidrug resistance protein